jgi:hypothetical protein
MSSVNVLSCPVTHAVSARLWRALLILTAVALAPSFCCAQVADRAEKAVCAIVDASGLSMTPILETKVFELPQTAWVERTEIARVLQEQELQAAFSPEGAGRRSALGQLLKADVLILLRSVKQDDAHPEQIECVICETKQGLRLFKTVFASAADQERSVELLQQGVESALAKHRQKIQAIVAVPPFLSDDLDFKNNYLQDAYAKLVEQTLLERPSIVLVELSEAQAIAREIALTKPGTKLERRKLPFYVIGRYRQDGTDKEKTLRISLRLMQSETQLTLKGVKDLPSADVASWLLKKTKEIEPLIDDSAPAADVAPGAEARQLAARAKHFQKVGNWHEALALYEASLLLQDEADVHRECVIICGKVAEQNRPEDRKGIDSYQLPIRMHLLGLQHLERLAELGDESAFRPNNDERTFLQAFEGPQFYRRNNPHVDAQTQALVDDYCRRRSETYLRICRSRALKKYDRTENCGWSELSVKFLTDDERYAAILRVANEWQDLGSHVNHIVSMATSHRETVDAAKYEAFLEKLASIKPHGPYAVASIKQRLHELEQSLRGAPLAPKSHDPLPVAHPAIRQITFKIPPPESKVMDDRIVGSMPLADGSDLFWSSINLFSMQKRGELRLIHTVGGRDQIVARAYDGKYYWLALFEDFSKLKVFAIDIETKKAIEFGETDGLPVPPAKAMDHSEEFQLAAVSPGHVCAVGFFGRTWIANLHLSANGDKKVDLFHEARQVPTAGESNLAGSTTIAFRPSFMHAIHSADAKSCRIVLGRNEAYVDLLRTPLVIDPYAHKVELAPFELYGNRQDVFAADKSEILFLTEGPQQFPKLTRIRYPAQKLEDAVEEVPHGYLVLQGDQLNILGKKWWTCDLRQRKVKLLVADVGWFYPNFFFPDGINREAGIPEPDVRIRQSIRTNHYGVAAIVYTKGLPHWYYLDASNLEKP